MSQHNQKFESVMFEFCSNVAERAYKLIEDGDTENGLNKLGQLADVLQFLVDARTSTGTTGIGVFANSLKELEEIDKDEVYTHLQENGFGQFIAE